MIRPSLIAVVVLVAGMSRANAKPIAGAIRASPDSRCIYNCCKCNCCVSNDGPVDCVSWRPGRTPVPEQLDLANYLPYLVNRLGAALVARMTARALAAHELNIDMWLVLAVLSYRGAPRQIDLVGMTSIDASTMSRLVTRLVRRGIVT